MLKAATTRRTQPAPGPMASLDAEADTMRAQLSHLRRELADARRELGERVRAGQHDALTGTPNRSLMADRIERAIAVARRRGTRIAVCFIDLDHFKAINDRLGHAAGDSVLQRLARRLESVVRESDSVGRHGGDEFLVMLADIAQASDAARTAQKLLLAIGEPCPVGEERLQIAVSMGIAIYPDDGEEPALLIARADAAMYRAKRRGDGGFEFHRPETPRRAMADRSLPLSPSSPSPSSPRAAPMAEATRRRSARSDSRGQRVLPDR